MSIPLRDFGKTGVKISALGLGGHHGGGKDEKTAIEIVDRALDVGVTIYDNAWEYYRGKILCARWGEGERYEPA